MWRKLFYIYLGIMFAWFAVCKMRDPMHPIPVFKSAYLDQLRAKVEARQF